MKIGKNKNKDEDAVRYALGNVRICFMICFNNGGLKAVWCANKICRIFPCLHDFGR